ncbi:RDD family protein [Microbacterium allomyrinae]|uniref:RDD family protein n=1 Tax=Microbacterium allomyrinae TaxID=2830666 RepID=A0A9X1LVS1_9MICO|nr:RDD family protein [Microbacterium allomyrinae]MCC2032989.1 RDD family protein [Microbacterium allomyrinae]
MTTSPPPAAPPASIGRRVGAYAIDLAILYAIGAVLIGIVVGLAMGAGSGGSRESVVLVILLGYLIVGLVMFAWWLVYSAMQGGRGSIGQRALGLRLQDAAAAGPIGFWRAVLRNIVWALAGTIVVGYFTPLFDSSGRRQGWHDMAAKAIVVDGRAAAASAPAHLAAAYTTNPYLPVGHAASAAPPPAPPRVATPHPPVAFPPATAAYPAPAAPPAPVAPATAFTAAAVAPRAAAGLPGGVISQVPGAHSARAAPDAAPMLHAAAVHFPATTTTTTPFPPASTTEPLVPVERIAPVTVNVPAPPVLAASPALAAGFAASADDDIDSTRLAAAVPPPAQRAALYPDAPVIAVLTWDDGTRMAVYGRTLYGRNPAGEDGAVAIAVRDETLSLSKTHFEIGGDAAAAWVVDRHSTNGTVLVRDGGRIPLQSGLQTVLRPGDRLEFGDRSAAVGAA